MRRLRFHPFALLLLVTSCAAARPSAEARAPDSSRASSEAKAEARPEEALDPAHTVALADGIYRDQLATQGRDERFATDRQVTELRRAISLYQAFIQRADGDPQFVDAVKRSRERIQDAEQTIAFLLSQADDDSQR